MIIVAVNVHLFRYNSIERLNAIFIVLTFHGKEATDDIGDITTLLLASLGMHANVVTFFLFLLLFQNFQSELTK
jgi:hypothetical protein